jgi:hypothetical protein
MIDRVPEPAEKRKMKIVVMSASRFDFPEGHPRMGEAHH